MLWACTPFFFPSFWGLKGHMLAQQLDEEDEQALDMFMPKEPRKRLQTLADVLDKMKEKQAEALDGQPDRPSMELNPKIVLVYEGYIIFFFKK